jgi:DNA-binding FadR family transcriptional regulator
LAEIIADSEKHMDDAAHLKKNNLRFHILLDRACGNPIFSVILESVFKLLIERSFDFLDHKLEKQFFKIHRDIFQLIAAKKAEEAKMLIEKDILDVKMKLLGIKEKNRKR